LGDRKPLEVSLTIIPDSEPSPAYLALMRQLLVPALHRATGAVIAATKEGRPLDGDQRAAKQLLADVRARRNGERKFGNKHPRQPDLARWAEGSSV
jgi:hypothetical protein